MTSRRDFVKIAGSSLAGLAVGGAAGNYLASLEKASLQEQIKALQEQLQTPTVRGGKLKIYTWTWYLNTLLRDQWASENKIDLVYDNFESTDEYMTWFKTHTPEPGRGGYDVVMVSTGYVEELGQAGLLEELDLSKIPNFARYFPDALKGMYYDPQNKYSAIYTYGTSGLAWNKKLVDPPITSWADVFDPAKLSKYKGRVTMLTDSAESIGAALMYLGYDPNDNNESHLQEAKRALIAQKPFLAAYAGTEKYMTGLQDETFWISHAYNGDIAGLVYSSSETEVNVEIKNQDVRYAIPNEGAIAWMDNFTIPKGAEDREAAYAWINFMLSPAVAAINSVTIKYPFMSGLDYVPVTIARDPMIFTPLELLKKLYPKRALSEQDRVAREKIWLEVMAA